MYPPLSRHRYALMLLLAGLCACVAPLRAPPTPKDPSGTQIVVRNLAWCDVRVFAVRRSLSHRLGMVTSMGTTTFIVPEDLADGNRVRLHVVPVGRNDRFTTDPVLVAEEQELLLTVHEPIRLSTYATRRK